MDISQDKRLALEKALLDGGTGGPVVLPFLFLEAITQNFSDEQLIGRGGFGAVYKGQLQNGMVVAVKKLHNRIEILEENFKREVACLIEAKHKNIVRFLGYCYQTQHTRKQFEGRFVWADERQMLFCFEYLSKGNLSDHLTEPSTGLQWKVRYQIIKGICEGVNYLHQQRIIHMDLKPQNILLDDSMVPKIVDFGLSRRLSESQSRTITEHIVGTPGYMAPEFLRSQTVTFKTDIYSLGVIIIEILMGYKEYSNVDKVLRSWTNTSVKSDPRLLEQVKVCADIGINCMDDNPGNRPAIEDIIHILDETDLSISSRDSSRFVPQPANRSLWRFHGKVLKNVNAGLWMNLLASLYFSVRSVGSTSSAGQLVDEPESTTVFSALSQLEEPESTTVFSASSQREQSAFDRFYQHYRLAKKACKPMRISAYTAPKETTTEPSPGLSEIEQLDVHPLELCFSLEAKKPIKCSLNLVNRTDCDVICLIIPQFPDMYAYTDELRYYRLYLDPMSTGILNVTMVEQEQPPVDTGMFLILMIAMGTESDGIEDLMSSVDYDFLPKIDDDLLKRLEELGGEMHAAAVLTAVACPPVGTDGGRRVPVAAGTPVNAGAQSPRTHTKNWKMETNTWPEAVPRHHTIAARSGSCAMPSDMHDDHAVAVTNSPDSRGHTPD
ncbi:uncharacterized protein [Miscanthus floridulus]|uniref:uncharacterized protein n=1 Tax=Miscanthus floridulus TaxID=154761 RepID=UPI0034593F90